MVTNATGIILDDSDFYTYGAERTYLSTSDNNYKFNGKERDSESGLDNFVATRNSSSLGRFLTTLAGLRCADGHSILAVGLASR